MVERIAIPRVVIAGSGSSSGKTMITTGLARCLAKRGLKVQTFKVGPDFIDPQYLTLASGRPCVNLDSWLMTEEDVLKDFIEYSQDVDLVLIEGVRSLYDSAEPLSLRGSTWSIANIIKAPIILVIDVSGINIGAAAIAKGFSTLINDTKIMGVILNKVRGKAHTIKARAAVEGMAKLKVVGAIPKLEDLKVEMRHLGLVPAIEKKLIANDIIEKWCHLIEESVDVDKVIEIAREAPTLVLEKPLPRLTEQSNLKVKVAVAFDEAFNFYYKQNLDVLRRFGAEIVFFSPLRDSSLKGSSGLIIGGGYPQLFLAELQGNASIMLELKRLIEDECPTYAECGGLVYLCEEIEDFEGRRAEGLSIIPAKCRMNRHSRFLSYTHHKVIHDNVLSTSGAEVRGHEFHYSTITVNGDVKYAYEVLRGFGIDGKHDGIVIHNALASYTHILASGQEHLLKRFVNNCLHYSRR
ncbi:MAG: cobyrinate a,c-diamide synthase [Candidatus Nezhaarchaeales archaeon]